MILTKLTKGDIFKFDNQSWDSLYRFYSLIKHKDGRFLINLMGILYKGEIKKAFANSFTWRDIDVEVFIPTFYLCEFKKTKGIPCIPVSNHRIFFPTNLNQLNLSDKYCNHNKYWYDFVQIKL